MEKKVAQLRENSKICIEKASTLQELEEIRVKFLGKKGELTELSKGMKDLTPEQRPIVGQLVNELREFITSTLEEKTKEVKEEEKRLRVASEVIDITLPGRKVAQGTSHPLTETMNFMKNIFIEMGFDVADGPEVETVEYNFDALNIPQTHPSRDITDTFYINDDVIIRTQTSPVQIRYMLENKPPFRMICPGKVYRPDYDISHTPMFHQMEGLMVGENISFANFKAILTQALKKMFGDTEVRFRPHFFPFTEPSAEVDIQCAVCKGKGCRMCKESGWVEIMGCGMVDPEVFKAVGYNPDEVTGFAFGMGIERVTMLRKGINDLRAFFENDTRFLRQFK